MNPLRIRWSSAHLVGGGLLACATGGWVGGALAGPPSLPVPCLAGSCGANASGFVSSGAATAVQTGNNLAVKQTSNTAALNWSSFNIGAGGKVVFTQPSSSSIALNRIFDANPSTIFGTLTANGQIYLINANGFMFGSGANVNVAGLIASSLNMSTDTFNNGILSPFLQSKPALQPFTDASNNDLANTGTIQVASGATLTAASGGRLLLAAPTVQNAGTLSAPEGQVILAAGQKVYLDASADPTLRGLLVEVDGGGQAANKLTGLLSAAHGNVSMVGLMVNQDGRVSATTSVSANGSVTLIGGDTNLYGSGSTIPTRGGTVELGACSSIDISPDISDTTTAVVAQVQLPSTIDITAQSVFMHGATIHAPSGTLNVIAATDPQGGVVADSQARIRVDAGTTIDLAGSNAVLPMSANLVTVQLRSNELADDPTQRNGALRGDTVVVDMRADAGKGTPIADLSSAFAAVGSNVAQRTETGGIVNFQSGGDIVFNPGATINVSGGATTYQGGTIQTTALVGANGQLYDIGSANPLLTYKGVVNPTVTQSYNQWGIKQIVPTPGLGHYESGYVQGANGGSVEFAAPSMALSGTLKGSVVSGPYQRGPIGITLGDAAPSDAAPSGATLIIGFADRPSGNVSPGNQQIYNFFSPSVALTASPTPIVVADDAALPVQTLQLPVADLTQSGFGNIQIYSNTSVTLAAGLPLQLAPGALFTVKAPRIDIDSSISAPAGILNFENVLTVVNPSATGPRVGIGVGDGVTLDVSGQWTNDSILGKGVGTAPTLQNAGSINLQLNAVGGELVLGNRVALKSDGGAWVESGGTLAYGTGGAITLDASPAQAGLQFGNGTNVEAFGTGTALGGSLSLLAPRIEISQRTPQGDASAWTRAQRVDDLTPTGQVPTGQALDLYAPLFNDYGFSNITLTATGASASSASSTDVLTVASGTTISAQTRSRALEPGYQYVVTGGDFAKFLTPVTLPDYLRPATNLSLVAERLPDDYPLAPGNFGTIDIPAGASILSGPTSTISLISEGSITVGGTLRAPGGTLTLQIPQPPDLFDTGYVATQGIDLAPTGILDVKGTSIFTPNSQGLLLGTVLPGGSVSLLAERGTVIAEPGSSIDISGTQAALDIANARNNGNYSLTTVASAGGSLSISSNESISLLGNLSAAAGTGGAGGQAAAGSLALELTEGLFTAPGAVPVPGDSRQFELVDSTAGTAPSVPYSGVAVLGVAQLVQSGIDSLTLQTAGGNAPGNILIDTSSALSLGRQIVFDSPTVTVANGFNARVSAPFVQIGNSQTNGASAVPPAPLPGTGTLTVSAQQMTLLGAVALQGITGATLQSQGDVQLEGTNTTNNSNANPNKQMTGSLTSSGNLTIDAARVYPATYTNFTLQSPQGTGTTVTIGPTAASPGSPLSADGSVTVTADNILVSGTLLAPFGSINLTANDSLKLTSGSLISVSGAGLDVPFGQTQYNAAQWLYTTPNGYQNYIVNVPTKQVVLSAPNISQQGATSALPAATVNLQGGGDLYAYEFVPGTGGSADALKLGTVPGLYAILPGAQGQAAPYDAVESASPTQTQTVYLSGGAGIVAGYYALLPPRYALLPGAALVQFEPSYVSSTGGQIGRLADGTPVIGGFVSAGTTGLHTNLTEYQTTKTGALIQFQGTTGLTQYEGFAVYPGSYGQQLAAYTISNASSYFGNQAAAAGIGSVAEPADAGTLTIKVSQPAPMMPPLSNSLDLNGSVLTAAASGGRGALVNISAPDLFVSANTTDSASTGVTVLGSVLQGWDASMLTLGGITSTIPISATGTNSGAAANKCTGTCIEVAANTVTVQKGVSLTADQIEIVAQQSIDVQAGAVVASTSGARGTALKTLPSQQIVNLTDTTDLAGSLPQGALLAVSDLYLPVVGQIVNNVPVLGGSALNGATGATINLATGATMKSGGAIAFDAPGTIGVAGTISGKGASWSLSSSSISFLGSTDTLNIDSTLLGSLQTASAIRIASAGSIDIDAPVKLGASQLTDSPTLSSLTLIGTSLNNNVPVSTSSRGQSDSTFGAATLTLGGAAATSSDPYAAGGGTLSLVANNLIVGPGTLAINGFNTTQAQVGGAFETQGSGGLNIGGALNIKAVELTSAPDLTVGGGTTIQSTGLLTIGTPTTLATGNTLPTLIGGNLTFSAPSIDDAGAIVMPSGLVSLKATNGNLHLANTATINTAGTTVAVVNQKVGSPGGAVSLTASDNVTLDAGSAINVAGAGTAPAGSLSITGGVVDVSSTLTGAAGTGTGGNFTLNAGQSANGLTALAANLWAGGFTNAINVRLNSGNLDLANGGTLQANTVTLTADNGSVDIAGTVSASSAATRGFIELSGGTGVTLTGQLHADGTGSAGRGGEIDINSTCPTCSITLASGSSISATGSAQMGELVLRAPWWNTTDVAINNQSGPQNIGAIVQNAGRVIVEPVSVFAPAGSNPTGTNPTTITVNLQNDVSSALQSLSQSTIGNRLTSTTASITATAPISVQAGVEIQDLNPNETLTMKSIDLSANSAPSNGGNVVDLTVRAAGSITIDGKISDGIVTDPATNSQAIYSCSSCASGSLSFVAGADVASANPLATLAGSGAYLKLGTGLPHALPGIVRTGTGDLNLIAARDVIFSPGAAAYTVGTGTTYAIGATGRNAGTLVNLATGGGNVRINAGGNVTGSIVTGDNGDYSVTGWQIRQGDASTPALYGNNLAAFDWNTGALGGGDVTVTAGGQVNNLSAAVADSYADAAHSPTGVAGLVGAGGGLSITAGGDIGSAQVYVADGAGTLLAGGGLTAIRANTTGGTGNLGSSFALGNSTISVWAQQGIQVDAVYNPTYVAQSTAKAGGNGAYLTYGANSALDLASTDGTVTFNLLPANAMGTLLGESLPEAKNGSSHFLILPGTVSIESLQQDINVDINGQGVLYPSATGQLVLFAGRDIAATGAGGGLTMADSFGLANSVPTVASPGAILPTLGALVYGFAEFQGDIHQGDSTPALITAGRDLVNMQLSIPEASQIVAGRDILDLAYTGQNLSAGDTTLILAGRDMIDNLTSNDTLTGGIKVGGPGSLDVFTGRNLNLGFGNGILTLGNLSNVNLPTGGADVSLMVGYGTQGADSASFLKNIVAPSSAYQAEFITYVESLTGDSTLTFSQAETAFAGLTPAQQAVPIDNMFFNELLLSGRAANSGTGVGFSQGYAAIDALFPNSRTATATGADPYAGNLNLTATQIYTLSGGNISILVPGGQIDVGLATPPTIVANKPAQSLGIVAQGTGNIDIYTGGCSNCTPPTKGDVNVNKSRIFTLGGGNILIWSDQGSIDAGNGSKSSLSAPPPVIQFNSDGTFSVTYGASLAGSGIRTIQTDPSFPLGNVDLDAPVGTVNAGDAGIGAAGNINIAAAHVIGVNNINFGGTATGVPSDISSLGASLSGASAVASSSTSSATSSIAEASAASKEVAPLAQTALSWLDVFVIGLGEENCKPDDVECLKRQKTASP